ncbi:hypothetical protein Tco_0444034, partial [Tanacetum coccineum]
MFASSSLCFSSLSSSSSSTIFAFPLSFRSCCGGGTVGLVAVSL